MSDQRPPCPPFSFDTANQKVRAGEDAWNRCDPRDVARGYSTNSRWRDRVDTFQGREKIIEVLTRKWDSELEYRLINELWSFTDNRIAVRFAYEYRDDSGNWFRCYGNENWEFDQRGFIRNRHASVNDKPITEAERSFHWDRSRPRPMNYPSLSDLGL